MSHPTHQHNRNNQDVRRMNHERDREDPNQQINRPQLPSQPQENSQSCMVCQSRLRLVGYAQCVQRFVYQVIRLHGRRSLFQCEGLVRETEWKEASLIECRSKCAWQIAHTNRTHSV
eukprot:157050_1